MAIRAKWKYGLKGARGVTHRCPVICGDAVLVTINHGMGSTCRSTLAKVNLDTGEEQWRFDTEHLLNKPSVLADGSIITTCFDGAVYRLDAQGKVLWQAQPSKKNLWAGIAVGDKYYYAEIGGTSDSTWALNIADGSVAWSYQNGGHAYALATDHQRYIVHSCAAGSFDDTAVYLYCFGKDAGHVVWQVEHQQYLFEPLIDNSRVYIGSREHIAVFNLESGELIASYAIDKNSAVTIRPIKTEHGIVFVTDNGHVFCLQVTEGKKGFFRKQSDQIVKVWSTDLCAEVKADIVYHNGQLLVMHEEGCLAKLDPATGDLLDQVELPSFKEGRGMAIHGNDMYLAVSKDCAKLPGVI